MIKMIITSFKFNNAYYANTLIYRLKQLPLIGKYIPKSLYSNDGLKILFNIIVSLYKIIAPFVGKFIYIYLLMVMPIEQSNDPNTFLTVFVFLTLVGAFCNTGMFNPTKEKYYSIILMRTNAKKYALSSLMYFLFKILISFYPAVIIFGLLLKVNIFILLLLPIFVVLMKLIGNRLLLMYYEKKNKVLNENNFVLFGIVSVTGLLLAYGLPYLGYSINNLIFIIIFVLSLIFGLLSLKHLFASNDYNKIYKSMLNLNTVIFNTTDTNTANVRKQYSSKIEEVKTINTNKVGYEYFNEIFTTRHRKILTKSAIKTAFILLAILLGVIIATRFSKDIYTGVNNITLTYLPYFVFIMYLVNRGSVVTQAMFINCDHSMLAYRFYRQPKVILSLFRIRLKTLIKINMIPTIVIALGLPLLLAITGGTTNPYNYLLLFISIIFLSIFFSVHHLVIYYLLQPYDINMKSKSSMYSIVNAITYFICYLCIDMTFPTAIFASIVTVFSLIYILVALFLVYKYAPRTFKLK